MPTCARATAGTLALLAILLLGCRDRPRTREERAKDALDRVAAIQAKLAVLRGFEVSEPIPAEYQPPSAFREYVHRAVGEQTQRARDQQTALVALGLLPPSADLAHASEDAYATQAAAYYDPLAKKFFLVQVPDNEIMLDMILAHELTHGLQDQQFGLTRFLSQSGGAADSDALTARRFVAEGDATLAMTLYVISDKTYGRELMPSQLALIRTQLKRYASLDFPAMVELLKQQVNVSAVMDPETRKSLDSLDEIPRTVLVPLVDSYLQGALVALTALEHGGWASVNALYHDPPESTAEVLHPEELLFPRRDPRHVTLPALPDHVLVASDVVGELQWSVYFSLWKHDGAGHEERNWAGDRYAVWRAKDGELTVLIATIWDTERDAKVFYDAYRSTLRSRGSAVTHDHIWVRRHKDRVYVVDGGEHELMDQLVSGTTFN